MCHGELARSRPGTAHLTEFYLLMSLGGMLGGLFNSIVAPLVFTGVYEYPIAIVLACLLYPGSEWTKLSGRDIAWILGTLSAAVVIRYASRDSSAIIALLAQIGLAVFVFGWYARPIRFGFAIGAMLAAPYLYAFDSTRLEQKRSFFGVHTIQQERAGAFLTLKHGTTLHGAQYTNPTRRREPLTYYSTMGPIGQFFAALEGNIIERIGVVGLGTGSVSCYRQPGQNWTFFEIDAGIIETARSGQHFTFLRDCAPNARMVVGDARLSLAAEPPRSFELLILDAFSSDAIPVHLLTREAFSTYASRITPEGFLLVHVSNRHLKLAPLVANLGSELGMTALVQKHQPSKDEAAQFVTPSEWVVLTRSIEGLAKLAHDERWQELRLRSEAGVWTDDFSNLLGVLQ
jgi:spermidine synthase